MRFVLLLVVLIGMTACERKFSQEPMVRIPVIDEDFLANSLAGLESSIAEYPDNPDLYYQKASFLFYLQENAAMVAIDQAIELNSERPEFFFLRAQIMASRGDRDGALENARQAEILGETRVQLFELLAEIYAAKGNYLETLNYSNQVLKVNSFKYQPLLLKSTALLGLGDTINAEYFLRRALESDSEGAEAYRVSSRIVMSREQFDTASVLVSKAYELDPENPETLLLTAQWSVVKGDLDSAETTWKILAKYKPYQVNAWENLSSLQFDRGRYDSAMYYAEMILRHQPNDPSARLTIARSAERQGNVSLARQEYAAILEADSTHQIARGELENLNRKVAYLQEMRQQLQQQQDQISNIAPKKPVEVP